MPEHTVQTDADAELAPVHYLPTTTEPAENHGMVDRHDDEVVEGELISDDEYRRLTSQKALAQARYAEYRRDLVRVAHAARTSSTWSWQHVGRPLAHQARRHSAFVAKGAEQQRVHRKTEREQSDLKAARRAAAEQGDYAQVREISRQMLETRKVTAESLRARVDVTWDLTKRAAVAIMVLSGVAVVTGAINSFGHWLGPWDGLDVLYLLGSIVAGFVGTAQFMATHWVATAATLLSLVTSVWLSRRWRDGRKLGEMVLPVELRRGDAFAHVDFDESALVTALANIGLPPLKEAAKQGWPNRESDRAWVQFPVLDGPGMTTKLRLPQAAPVEKVKKAKTTLAHNLGCLPAELWLEKDEQDPTVLDMFRLNAGELRKPAPDFPLLGDDARGDYFAGIPVGVGPRREQITATLFERNYVISGIMGSGKSTLVMAILAGVALDPLVDIDVFVFAENNDYDALKKSFDTFVMGDTQENVDYCQTFIGWLHEDLAIRGRLLQKHGVKKVNREVAAKEPGLRPRVVVIDECQAYFRQDKPEDRRAVVNQMVRFFSAARKYGITCIFVTPIPSDQSLPRDLVSVTSNRASFAIGDKTRNNVVLGDKAHENGISAMGLKPADDESLNDVGTSVTVGFTTVDGTTLKTHYLNDEHLHRVASRAQQLRGGSDPAQPELEHEDRDLLVDVATVLGEDPVVKATDVVARLREHASGYEPYDGLTAEGLRDQLAAHSVRVSKSGVLKVYAERVHHALAARAEVANEDGENPA